MSQYCIASLHVLLHGDESLHFDSNHGIFVVVYKYIQDNKRVESLLCVDSLVISIQNAS